MSFSYSNPLTVPRDAVRCLIGDTVATAALFQDAELDYFLYECAGKPKQAALMALDALATRFANQVNITLGKLSLANSDRAKAYADRAAALRKLVGLSGIRLAVGGRTLSERYIARSQTDALQPGFEVGGNDYVPEGLVWDRWA